jgi:hypothetical protein
MVDDVFHVRIMGVERSDGEWGTRLTFTVHDGFNTRVDLDTNMLGVGAMLLRPLYAWCKKHGVERTGRAKLENNDSYTVTGGCCGMRFRSVMTLRGIMRSGE